MPFGIGSYQKIVLLLEKHNGDIDHVCEGLHGDAELTYNLLRCHVKGIKNRCKIDSNEMYLTSFKDGNAPKSVLACELLLKASKLYEEISVPIDPEHVALASKKELLCVPGCGRRTLRYVEEWLGLHGLKLHSDEAA